MEDIKLETHPFEPFIPEGARVLIMGTFPPPPTRWSMKFYYPNPTNDFWRICGLLFYGDKDALYLPEEKRFDEGKIREMLTRHHIALNDTGARVRRLMGNASDKYLEIVEPVNLDGLLARMPHCRGVATTGEKAAEVVARLTGTEAPKMGQYVTSPTGLELWRMPSTSRAYPLRLEKKAEYYARMLEHLDILK